MNRLLKILKSKIYFDQYLFISITILSIMGLLFLYSASQGNIETTIKQSFFVVSLDRHRQCSDIRGDANKDNANSAVSAPNSKHKYTSKMLYTSALYTGVCTVHNSVLLSLSLPPMKSLSVREVGEASGFFIRAVLP